MVLDNRAGATVITGMGICCAAGNNLPEVWSSLLSGQVNNTLGAERLFTPHPASPLFTVKTDNILSLCDSSFLKKCSEDRLARANRTIGLALKACEEALTMAGLAVDGLAGKRVGIALGTTVGCTFHNEQFYLDWREGRARDIEPVLTYLSANLSESLQAILNVAGPRAVVTNACASGTDAIGLAKAWLEHDLCDVAIAGGADEISRTACHGFSSLMLFSQNSCRPFDAQREGLNLGEGAGVLLLEQEQHVRSRAGTELGRLRGYGAAGDAYHPTAPHPEGKGLQQAIHMSCREAGIDPGQLHYINAHGTGTQANDKAELTALMKAGLSPATCPPIVSTKGATGHTLGAAGGIEAVITLQSLLSSTATGTTGCTCLDPSLPPLQVSMADDRQDILGKLGMSQSLAFGGGNSAVILEAAA